MTLEQRREQARANLETIRRVRVRRAQERLALIEMERARRVHETPTQRLRRACWRALVRCYRDGVIPAEFYEKHPGLREQLEATVAAVRGSRAAKSE